MKRNIIIGVIVFVIGITLVVKFFSSTKSKINFQFTELKYGNIENTISSTGTIKPIRSVEVGTQVSGIVDKVFVDFNEEVKTGQILAILDTVNLALQVRDAQVNVNKHKIEYEQTKYEYEIAQELYDKGLPSELEIRSKKTIHEIVPLVFFDYQIIQTKIPPFYIIPFNTTIYWGIGGFIVV